MSKPAEPDLARVTVISPTRRIDLALPGSVTLGELLPSIVRFSGYEGGSPAEAVHAWVLQRFGEDPLDPNALISKLSIRDGETLHLRQRENAIPDAAFDDVVDAVTMSTTRRPSWQPRHSQRMALAVLTALLVGLPLLMAVLVTRSTPIEDRGILWPIINIVLSVLAAIASISLSRAAGRYQVAATLAWASVVLAGLGGWQMLATPEWAPRLVVASALVLIAAGTCALAARVTTMGLFTAALVGGILLVVSTVDTLIDGNAVHVAAVAASVLLAITGYMPTLSYRLARIALPQLPTTAEAVMADDQPVQSDIVSRAVLADQLLASMLTAIAVTTTLLSLVLLVDLPGDGPGARSPWWQIALAACLGLALLLRARVFVGLTQRLALVLSGTIITTAAGITALMQLPDGFIRIGVTVLVVAASAAILAYYASVTYSRVMTPIWGRLGDVLEWLSVMAIVPVLLGVLNLYAAMRGLIG